MPHIPGSPAPREVQRLLSHLGECRRRLSDLRGRQDYLALSCAMLRLEGEGGTILYNLPFATVLGDRPFHPRLTVEHGDTFAVAFYTLAGAIQADRIPAALTAVEAITGETHQLLRELPKPIRERLQLPESDHWWRVVFHLAWHFLPPFLRATRWRLLAKDGASYGRSDETIVQLYGTGGLRDLLPGLIYSELELEHDLCTCSEAAIGVIVDALERHLLQRRGPVVVEVRSALADPAERRRLETCVARLILQADVIRRVLRRSVTAITGLTAIDSRKNKVVCLDSLSTKMT